MTAIVLVAAAGVFVLGAVAGIVAVVRYGIHREQKRLRSEQGIWAGPDASDHFLAEQAPDVVSGAATRRLNGLYVHHLPLAILGGRGCGPGGSQRWGRSLAGEAQDWRIAYWARAGSQFGRASNGQPDDMWQRYNGGSSRVRHRSTDHAL
jgi:hypothetical protein